MLMTACCLHFRLHPECQTSRNKLVYGVCLCQLLLTILPLWTLCVCNMSTKTCIHASMYASTCHPMNSIQTMSLGCCRQPHFSNNSLSRSCLVLSGNSKPFRHVRDKHVCGESPCLPNVSRKNCSRTMCNIGKIQLNKMTNSKRLYVSLLVKLQSNIHYPIIKKAFKFYREPNHRNFATDLFLQGLQKT